MNIEDGFKLAILRIMHGLEIDHQGFSCQWVADASEQNISGVVGVAIDDQLRGEYATPVLADR